MEEKKSKVLSRCVLNYLALQALIFTKMGRGTGCRAQQSGGLITALQQHKMRFFLSEEIIPIPQSGFLWTALLLSQAHSQCDTDVPTAPSRSVRML